MSGRLYHGLEGPYLAISTVPKDLPVTNVQTGMPGEAEWRDVGFELVMLSFMMKHYGVRAQEHETGTYPSSSLRSSRL